MAGVKSLVFNTDLNNSGIEAGVDEIKEEFNEAADSAKQSVEKIDQAIDNIDAGDAAKGMSESFDTETKKVEQILEDTQRSQRSKVMSIAAIYRRQGMTQQEAMSAAWAHIEGRSEKGAQNVKKDLKGIGKTTKAVSSKMSGDITGALGGLGAVVGKLGAAIGAAFSVGAVVAFSKSCLDLGSDLQEVQNVVDVTFSTMSAQVDNFAKDAKNTAGLSETMAKQYVGTFGAMAKSFGFAEGEALGMSTALTQLAGDVASFYNLSQEAAYTKLKSVFTGETEALKDLGVVMTQTALDSYALAQGFGKTTDQMTEQEKVALRYRFVMDRLSGASGDFLRTADGWANQSRMLNLQFEQLKATLGQGLINALTPAIRAINDLIGQLQALADQFVVLTEDVFGDAGGDTLAEGYAEAASGAAALAHATDEAGKATKRYLAGFDQIQKVDSGKNGATGSSFGGINGPVVVGDDIKDKLSPKITSIFRRVRDEIDGAMGHIKREFSPALTAWEDAFRQMAPSVEDAFETLGDAAMDFLADTYAPTVAYVYGDLLPSVYNDMARALAPIVADTMPVAMGALEDGLEDGTILMDQWAGDLRQVYGSVASAFDEMCDSISRHWDIRGSDLLSGVAEFQSGMRELWWDLYDGIIRPVVDVCAGALDGLWKDHLKPLWGNAVYSAMSIGENILILWNKFLKPLVNQVVAFLTPTVVNVVRTIVDLVANGIATISGLVSALMTVLDGFIQFFAGVFSLDLERALEGLLKLHDGFCELLEAYIKSTVNTLIWVLNSMLTPIYSAIVGFINGLGVAVSNIGSIIGQDWGWSALPSTPPVTVPYLARGAVLPANKPFLAMVGDQKHGTNVEAPLSTIEEAVANVMGDMLPAMLAGFEAVVAEQKATRQAVENIEIGDTTIGEAAQRYDDQMAIIRGGK